MNAEQERERWQAELALVQARLACHLWQLPMMTNEQVPVALGISQTMWQTLKLEGRAPDGVWLGKRVFYRPADLLRWIALGLEAKKTPGEEPGVSVEQEPV